MWEKREKSLFKSSFFLWRSLFVSYLSKMGVGKRHPHQIRTAHIKHWVEEKQNKTSSHTFTGVQNQEEIMEIYFLFSLRVTRGAIEYQQCCLRGFLMHWKQPGSHQMWEKVSEIRQVIRFYKTAKAFPSVSSIVTEETQAISKGDFNSSKQLLYERINQLLNISLFLLGTVQGALVTTSAGSLNSDYWSYTG